MEWPNETILKFLDHYAQEPIIWNASHPKHKNRNELHDAWKRIQEHMDVFSVDELKKKKDSLMASFRTNLNKVKTNIKSGSSYKPSWFAYDRMAAFLLDRDEPRVTIKSEVIESQSPDNFIDLIDQPDYALVIENDEIVLPSTSKNSPRPPSKKRPKPSPEERTIKKKMDDAYSILQASFSKPEKDMCDIYGELVAAKLRKLDERSRQICMHRMDTVMFEMFMNTSSTNQATVAESPASSVQSHSSQVSQNTLTSDLSPNEMTDVINDVTDVKVEVADLSLEI